MADNKNYNFDNFDDTKIYGKHFKEEEPKTRVFSDEFDVDETRPFSLKDDYNNTENSDTTDDYGDDFYSDASNFDNEDEDDDDSTQAFSTVST